MSELFGPLHTRLSDESAKVVLGATLEGGPGRAPKRRFSELACEAFCNQEYARALKQRLDDEPEPIIAQGEPLVLKHPSVTALDRPAALAQSRSGWLPTLVDLGRDPEEAAQLAMVLGVVALIGEHGPDPG